MDFGLIRVAGGPEELVAGFSIARAAVVADMSESHVRSEIRNGNLRAKKRGRRVIILAEDLAAYLRNSEDWTPGEAPAALNIATQAGFKAVFEYAEGMAALGVTWGVPNPSSIAHFAAASTYAGIAAIAGGVGVAAGIGARFAGGGGGGSSSSSQNRGGSAAGGGQVQQQDLRPVSRVSDDAYMSGHRSDAVVRILAKEVASLRKIIEVARPGDVLVRGIQQKKGLIAQAVSDDVGRNSALGSKLARKMGMR